MNKQMMRRHWQFAKRAGCVVVCVAIGAAVAGCLVRVNEGPEDVRIELVNDTPYDLAPAFFHSATAQTPETLYVNANFDTSFIDREFPEMRPGETIAFELRCDDTRSFGVNRPRAFDAATLTVFDSTDSVFRLRDATYACGTTVTIVYFIADGALRVETR